MLLQQVHINRLEINSIEFEDDIVEIPLSPGGEHSFEIAVINYGAPTNVYFSISDNLEDYVTFLEDNPYVAHEEYVPVIAHLPVDGKGFVEGEIYVIVGYGSKTAGFSVNIGNEKSANIPVDVDVDDHITVENMHTGNKLAGTNRNRNKGYSNRRSCSVKYNLDISSRFILFVSGVLIVSLMAYVLYTQFTGIEFEIGFYPAVILSILFTALIMYLFLKLPINK
ncbi:MAG: hypothetical protein ACLFMM_00735 [Methanohalobium sp.]|uniref:DUF7524 family protein n=1 Tax=Methanohalobium sp. TaxID=2837493 RepID=UPI00397C7755